MKKIFLVEDDAVIVEIYRKKFQREGYEVAVAEDGLTAMRDLLVVKPDLVVLDLMLPKFNGADVLKFIRSKNELKHTKVVIFSNAYMTELALEAARAGADASLLKSSATPQLLLKVVKELLHGDEPVVLEKNAMLAATETTSPPPPKSGPSSSENIMDLTAARPFDLPKPDHPPDETTETLARRDFLQNGAATLASIRGFVEAFAHSSEPQFRLLRLLDLHRQFHFFTDKAALAGCQRIAHLAGAVEALLFELQERPKNINPSTIQTIQAAVALVGELFSRATQAEEEPVTSTNLLAVLVVDDEPLSNRALVHALSRANVKPTSTASSATALEMLQKNNYDLLLLDYLMPGMDGLELYRKLRALPQYQKTPVIFVTSTADFKDRAPEVLQRGDDIITKPILPIELAVKSLTLLLKSRLSEKKL